MFKHKESANAGKKGYDIIKVYCNSCNKILMEMKIGVTGADEKEIGLDEGMIEDLVLRKMHKQCPFCNKKVVDPKTEANFVEEGESTPPQQNQKEESAL